MSHNAINCTRLVVMTVLNKNEELAKITNCTKSHVIWWSPGSGYSHYKNKTFLRPYYIYNLSPYKTMSSLVRWSLYIETVPRFDYANNANVFPQSNKYWKITVWTKWRRPCRHDRLGLLKYCYWIGKSLLLYSVLCFVAILLGTWCLRCFN